MLRIAVCDDEEQQRQRTVALLERYLGTRPALAGQVETFQSCEELLARAEAEGGFDLYLLDILMPGLSGIDAGRRLRALGDGGEGLGDFPERAFAKMIVHGDLLSNERV